MEEAGNLNVPMGSTKKVGEFVRGGRVPEEYDSSPTLYSKNLGEKEKKKRMAFSTRWTPWTGREREGTSTLTSENADMRSRSLSGRAPLL